MNSNSSSNLNLGEKNAQIYRSFLVFVWALMSSYVSAAPFVSGKVYREFKIDGTAGLETEIRYRDIPLAGVEVLVFDENGIQVSSTLSAEDGSWSVDVGSTPGTEVQVEFIAPEGFTGSPLGGNNESSVAVVAKGATGVDFTVGQPSDHSEDNPFLASSCFVTTTDPSELTLVALRYNDTLDYAAPSSGQNQDDFPVSHYSTVRPQYSLAQQTILSTLATSRNTGGIAWNRRDRLVYGGIYHKWEVRINIGEMGRIYATTFPEDGSPSSTSLWLDLNTALGIPGVAGTYAGVNENQDRGNIGQIGFSDVEISDDNRTLYAYNARTLQVHAIPIAEDGSADVSAPSDIATFQIPPPATGSFSSEGISFNRSAAGGLGFHDGRVFATATITGPTLADMRGFLYSFDASADPTSVVVKQELELDYSSWIGRDVLISGGLFFTPTPQTNIAPWRLNHVVEDFSPWFFDIDFDTDASGEVRMSLGTRNRAHESISPDELNIDPTRGGYIHRAYRENDEWVLESNGEAGTIVTGLDRSGDIFERGQEGAQFYHGEGIEGPMMHGSLAVIAGFKEAAGMATDNMYGDWDSGVSFHSLSNGLRTRDNNIIFGRTEGYAKGISWGDIEALPSAPPLEIGNFVWIDDGDGVQEAGEAPVVGATVCIYLDDNGNRRLDDSELTTPVACTTTDGRGYYTFDLNDGLEYFTDYIITLNTPSDYAVGGALANLVPTLADAGSDTRDSDGIVRMQGFSEAPVRVGNLGETNHSYDFGFIQTLAVGNLVFFDANGDGDRDPGEPGLPGVTVTLLNPDTTTALQTNGVPFPPVVTDANGNYVFSSVPEGDYIVKITAPSGLVATVGGADPDGSSVDNDSNGVLVGVNMAQTPVFSLSVGDEPVSEDADENTDFTVDFGLILAPGTTAVGNFVFNDSNQDGLSIGDSGLAGATVELCAADGVSPATDNNGNIVPSQVTGSEGTYLFSNLVDGGVYVVKVTPPLNFAATTVAGIPDPDDNPADDDSNGQPQPSGVSVSPPVTLVAGSEPTAEDGNNNTDLSVDFGFSFVPFSLICNSEDVNGGTLVPGDTLTYTIKLNNASGFELTDVNLLNPLPAGTTFVPNSVTVTGASSGGGGGPSVQLFDFESGLPTGWIADSSPATTWMVGAPTIVGPAGQVLPSGTNLAGTNLGSNYGNNSNVCLTTELFDFSSNSSVTLRYDEWVEIEGEGFDTAVFQRRVGGGPWVTLFTIDTPNVPGPNPRIDTAFGEISHDATSYAAGQTDVQWRWCLNTDGSVVNAGWYIDDFEVTALAGSEVTVADVVNFETDPGWTQNGPQGGGGGTSWEIGASPGGIPGLPNPPSGAGGGVYATDLDLTYFNNITTPLCLVTTPYDFSTATEADIVLVAFNQIETGFDVLSFEYQVGTGPWNSLATIPDTGGSYSTFAPIDVPSDALGEPVVRFRFCLTTDFSVRMLGFYLDTFTVNITSPAGAGPATGAPPNLVTGATVADGETLCATFQVTVDAVPGVTSIDNSTSVTATADAQTTSLSCNVSDPLDLATIFRDYGDAPDTAAGTGAGNYETTLSDNGPSHIISTDGGATLTSVTIAGTPDEDPGTQQDSTATADDANSGDDEDGLDGTLTLIQGERVSLSIPTSNASGNPAFLYGWIDFNGDGVFESSERRVASVPDGSVNVATLLDFGVVPNSFQGSSVIRLRISTDATAVSLPNGPAADGEVEDHPVVIISPPDLDFGDLPDLASGVGIGDYETSRANDGASHIIIPELFIGESVDDESDGSPVPSADGDDASGLSDENGVISGLAQLEGFPASVVVSVTNALSSPATLYGFIDFNGDGEFNGPSETTSVLVNPGVAGESVTLSFGTVPAGSAATPTFARFRLSTDSSAAAPNGRASDGEVEDYLVTVSQPLLDFGDAPVNALTTLAEDGPRHVIGSGLVIGLGVDAETDGLEDSVAVGDDADGLDDEDGVPEGTTLVQTGSGVIPVLVTNPLGQAADLCAWLDTNNNGLFENSEQVTVTVPAGLSGTVDADFGVITAAPGNYVLRLRLSTDLAGCSPVGPARDGEVEDHFIEILAPELDFGDAPSAAGYPTTLADNGARHVLANGLMIGDLVDADSGALEDSEAAADDADGADDEDGVSLSLVAEGTAIVPVVVNNPLEGDAVLYGWIDYDGDGSFDNATERASITVPGGTSGLVELNFGAVPASAVNLTFARFRLSTDDAGAQNADGLATDGEVEDHPVTIDAVAFDFGDAPDAGDGLSGSNNYATLLSENGPRHVLANGLILGEVADADGDGQPNALAAGDNIDTGVNDEDGVPMAFNLVETFSPAIMVNVTNPSDTVPAIIYGWIDYNGDGLFDDSSERSSTVVPANFSGKLTLNFQPVPLGSASSTFARIRLSSDDAAASSATGVAPDGEVEDYPVSIVEPLFDFADAGFETLLTDDGARHLISNSSSTLFLGASVDSESDGAPTSGATGDDLAGGSDDEDAISGIVTIQEGAFQSIDFTATNTTGSVATVYAWIDYNQNDAFEVEESVRLSIPDGSIGDTFTLNLGVIPEGTAGNTVLRIRLSTDAIIATPEGALGAAFNGEVEDHPVTILPPAIDFADAPDTYSTLLASDGPSHLILQDGLVIGTTIDAEADGVPTAGATGDGGDEDGLSGTLSLVEGSDALVSVIVNNPTPSIATLTGWIDFDLNGSFDVSEQAAITVPAGTSGSVLLDFGLVPVGITGNTFIRLRLSNDSEANSPTGQAAGGEVEDHPVTISTQSFDFADAPDSGSGIGASNYRTTLIDNGPRHVIVPGIQLGASIDDEGDGQQSGDANGDAADEDGVNLSDLSLVRGVVPGIPVDVTNTLGAEAMLTGWIDFNGDGLFDNITERALMMIPAGTPATSVDLVFPPVPADAVANTFARFRISTDFSIVEPDGFAANGEVEDFPVAIASLATLADFGDAPDTGSGVGSGNYNTTAADGGPSHTVVSTLFLGAQIDGEADSAQPSASAESDDLTGDDEDGIDPSTLVLTEGLAPGVTATVTNDTGSDAILYGWIDFNGNGEFESTEFAQSAPIATGNFSTGVTLTFPAVPVGSASASFARFRLSTDTAAANPVGTASDGEVEDYAVSISPPASFDWGDAGFQTVIGDDGPNHEITTDLVIGALIDADNGTLSNTAANADDGDEVANDEDGILIPSDLILTESQNDPQVTVSVTNNLAEDARLYGWIDLNGNDLFDVSERTLVNVPSGFSGSVVLSFPEVPATANADTSGETVLRLRLSTDVAAANPTGSADDGEVEDHLVTVNVGARDFGDAPDSYGTTVAADGASHIIDSEIFLGTSGAPDSEVDGVPATTGDLANGDDLTNGDEDGVVGFSLLCASDSSYSLDVNVTNETGVSANIVAWIDFNGDGDFDANEGATAVADATGVVTLNWTSLPGITSQLVSYVRIRISTDSLTVDDPTGTASDGEVEDYDLEICEEPVGLGNLVFVDLNNDGVFNSSNDMPVQGTLVQLYRSGDVVGSDDPVDEVLTGTGATAGCYSFLAAPGAYFVHIPAGEFGFGTSLWGTRSIPGVAADSDQIDDNLAGQDNGIDAPAPASTGVSSQVISLSVGDEPIETGKGATVSVLDNFDFTVDLGFISVKPATFGDFLTANAEAFGLSDNSQPGVPVLDPFTGLATGSTDGAIADLSALSADPDGDGFVNLVEYALCYDPTTGLKVFQDGSSNSGFNLVPNDVNPDQLDAQFTTPTDAADLNITLQQSVDGQAWTDVSGVTPTITPGDVAGTSLVTFSNVTNLTTTGSLLLRLRIDALDVSNGNAVVLSETAQILGFQEHCIREICESFADPFLAPCVYSGTVMEVSGQEIIFEENNLESLLGGGDLYLEVLSGVNTGERFDITSVLSDRLVLANDSELCGLIAPFNTVLGLAPSSLENSLVAVRRHLTIQDLFPVEAFEAGTDSSDSALILLFDSASQNFVTYQLDANGGAPEWQNAGGDSVMAEVITPGQGAFTHNIGGPALNDPSGASCILQFGSVRVTPVNVPLCDEFSFLAALYPIAQSANGTDPSTGALSNSRQMNRSNTQAPYIGEVARSRADQIQIWQDDSAAPGAKAHLTYDSLFYAFATGVIDAWVSTGDASLTSQNNELIFLPDRSAIIRIRDGADRQRNVIPSPIDPVSGLSGVSP